VFWRGCDLLRGLRVPVPTAFNFLIWFGSQPFFYFSGYRIFAAADGPLLDRRGACGRQAPTCALSMLPIPWGKSLLLSPRAGSALSVTAFAAFKIESSSSQKLCCCLATHRNKWDSTNAPITSSFSGPNMLNCPHYSARDHYKFLPVAAAENCLPHGRGHGTIVSAARTDPVDTPYQISGPRMDKARALPQGTFVNFCHHRISKVSTTLLVCRPTRGITCSVPTAVLQDTRACYDAQMSEVVYAMRTNNSSNVPLPVRDLNDMPNARRNACRAHRHVFGAGTALISRRPCEGRRLYNGA